MERSPVGMCDVGFGVYVWHLPVLMVERLHCVNFTSRVSVTSPSAANFEGNHYAGRARPVLTIHYFLCPAQEEIHNMSKRCTAKKTTTLPQHPGKNSDKKGKQLQQQAEEFDG